MFHRKIRSVLARERERERANKRESHGGPQVNELLYHFSAVPTSFCRSFMNSVSSNSDQREGEAHSKGKSKRISKISFFSFVVVVGLTSKKNSNLRSCKKIERQTDQEKEVFSAKSITFDENLQISLILESRVTSSTLRRLIFSSLSLHHNSSLSTTTTAAFDYLIWLGLLFPWIHPGTSKHKVSIYFYHKRTLNPVGKHFITVTPPIFPPEPSEYMCSTLMTFHQLFIDTNCEHRMETTSIIYIFFFFLHI